MLTEAPSEASGALGYLGGTFDPVHYGHLLLAELAREQFGLHRVLLIPSARPPHKLTRMVSAPEHRLRMAELAIQGNPAFEVSRCEIDREGPSYTITTIRELRAATGRDIVFITGADSVLDMHLWREPRAILTEANVVTYPRPGCDLDRVQETLGPDLARRVLTVRGPMLSLSSTEIRARVSGGLTIRYMVPESVEEYITAHGLYREGWPEH